MLFRCIYLKYAGFIVSLKSTQAALLAENPMQ